MHTPDKLSSLADLMAGTAGRILSVELDGLLRRRVLDLGMVPGTQVECIRKSPVGDPIAFRVRNTTIALRSDDASLIKIYPME
ncbi:FeoA family protein [Sporomusa acidovorans]|uniref:Ferrous iron transporter FeoA-like domain-containing protein n=1 Tax=Sporomusa acidovorans (strain ATCC 49682 / DSM 3132 / Mol) TaxID=1123286 RepID=A0ABZ3J2X0_SPOA4|nr:FeoA family protein [Sporomusa acidovorans]OZC23221.1 ferrous iron transport protein A [Sporomusa acidovorans DSM 3132]SDE97997.1 ferrous iron transport protein A [Sporomusa acidovorans]